MRPSTQRLRRGLLDIGPAMYRAAVPLAAFRMLPIGVGITPAALPIPALDEPGWRPVGVGDRWGGRDHNAWFSGHVEVPAAWGSELARHAALVLRLILGYGTVFGWPEGLLYVNGELRQGVNRRHPDALLRPDDAAGGPIELAARAWSGMEPVDHRIELAELALLDRDCEALYHLLAVGADVVDTLADDDPLAHRLHDALETAYDALDLRDPSDEAYVRSVRQALGALRDRLASLRAAYAPAQGASIIALGHAHLDVAWLWQTRHTREKAARTFALATALMEAYPEYTLLHSTALVFAWLKSDYPTVYETVRRRVAEGRFEAAGALWLECDCNLVSGESLVRQVLYGQRFLREEFGREYDVLWLPDAFGYSAALPQIMLKAGLRAFMTTKLSWSETNRIPADTFRWRGLDGSEVLAHFITTPSLAPDPPLDRVDTYNGEMVVAAVRGLWQRYREKGRNDELLLAFGYGDGGAGPTRQQLERAAAMRALPGLPALRFGRADEYFARLRERVWGDPTLPVWDGELYMEYHRGTYTSQAWLKRAHRACEGRLLLAELLDAWRWATDPAHAPDTRPTLDDAWRTLLLHEFHDILPGSSIGEVYADARAALEDLTARLEAQIEQGLRAVARQLAAPAGSWLIFNPSPWPIGAPLDLPAAAGRSWRWDDEAEGDVLDVQGVEDEGERRLLVAAADVPALGLRALVPAGQQRRGNGARARRGPARAEPHLLENDFFRVEFDTRGEIVSLVDKRVAGGRELAAPGARLNALQLFDDRPRDFDAWDIDEGYERKPYAWDAVDVEMVERGPLRATLRVARRMGASTVEQRISLYRDLPRIDFRTRADWHVHHVLLKAAFPLDLRVTSATFETQYGAIARPTHRNTSWDQARFEVPAHRWADLSEANYGVSLLNDGCYGHDVRDNVLRLTLLRSPTYPDPEADQGAHAVTYSLFPHLGDWRTGGTVQAAYALNRPPRALVVAEETEAAKKTGDSASARCFFQAEPENVVVEAVKRAANGDGLIVRLYEAHGARAHARVRCALPVRAVAECDLLERPLTAEGSAAYEAWRASRAASHDAPTLEADGWSCAMRPFEVRTFRVELANHGGSMEAH